MSILGLFAIGPVFHSLETVVLDVTKQILTLPFGLAGLIVGGVQQIIVVTGIHHIFNFLELQLLTNGDKTNPLNAYFTAAMAGQAGATFAVGYKTVNHKVRALAYSSGVSCLLGITEPAIFGVNLRYGKPFVMGLVAGAAGGWLAGLFKLAATGMSVTVLPGVLLYLNNIFAYLLVLVVSFGIGFGLTYAFGYKADKQA